MWGGLCRDQQSPKHTAQPQPMGVRAAVRHPAALPRKQQTSAASAEHRIHPAKLSGTSRPLFPFTQYKFCFTVKCFSAEAVLIKGSGDAEQQEPWGCSTSLVVPLPAALGSVDKPISLMGFIQSGPWAGLSPTMLISVTAASHRTFLHFKAKCSIP